MKLTVSSQLVLFVVLIIITFSGLSNYQVVAFYFPYFYRTYHHTHKLHELHATPNQNSDTSTTHPIEDDIISTGGSSASSAILDVSSSFIYTPDFSTPVESRSLRPMSLTYDTDVLGMLNFCLRTSDTALSGPSRSKILNEVTNHVFRAIIIGFDPLVQEILSHLPEYREMIIVAPCVLDPDERSIQKRSRSSSASTTTTMLSNDNNNNNNNKYNRRMIFCEGDLEIAQEYINWLEYLLTGDPSLILPSLPAATTDTASATSNGKEASGQDPAQAEEERITIESVSSASSLLLGGIYDRGYKRLITLLKDTGCRFHSPSSFSSPTATAVQVNTRPYTRPIPYEHNICLSLLDARLEAAGAATTATTASSSVFGKQLGSPTTKTKELNLLSNIVTRCILYGQSKERFQVAAYLEERAQSFAQDWQIPAEDDNEEEDDEVSGSINGGNNKRVPCQEVCYLQSLALLLKENLAAAEMAITAEYRDDDDSEEDSQEGDKGAISTDSDDSNHSNSLLDNILPSSTSTSSNNEGKRRGVMNNLRLLDAYQNAFHRVVEVCLTEIGSQNLIPTNGEEIIQGFLVWEQGLRRNLTMDLWNKNPEELVGQWELVDVQGTGSLKTIMTTDADLFFASVDGGPFMVEFLKNGQLDVKNNLSHGVKWYFKPGPAHLDTCEFYIASKIDPDLVLKYIGFIDRGQRIESRFSKSPIKMTGRVLSIVGGEIRGSSRFIMALKRKV